MNIEIKTSFNEKWEKYFPGSELPIACYYTNHIDSVKLAKTPNTKKDSLTCIFSQLAPVRKGKARAFNQDNLGCWGSKGIFGFIPSGADEQTVDFLVNVERYKKSAVHIKAMFELNPPLRAKGEYLVFKPWELLSENDNPEVVIFFCNPDVIAGLHGLANFDTMGPDGVIAPFGSGCESIVAFAMKELNSNTPKAVLGLFDASARTCIKPNQMTFSIPWKKFLSMLEDIDDCFLNTYVWEGIKKRLNPLKRASID